MLRVVIDTNILVSAIIDNRKPRQLVLKLLDEHTIVLSRQMLAELSKVIAGDKFTVKVSSKSVSFGFNK
jgi:putative PIN family toxin of toxin-antitoxin system